MTVGFIRWFTRASLVLAVLTLAACSNPSRGDARQAALALDSIAPSEEFSFGHPLYRENPWFWPKLAAGPRGYLAFGPPEPATSEPGRNDPLLVTRIDAEGRPLDPKGLPLATGTDPNLVPFVAAVHAGSHWVVTFRRGTELYCARVLEDGTLPDGEGHALGVDVAPAAMSYDGVRVLVLGSDGRAVFVSPTCAPATTPVAVTPPVSEAYYLHPSLAFDGSNFIVGYSTHVVGAPDRFVVQKVSPAGTLLGSPVTVASASWTRQELQTYGVSGVVGSVAARSGTTLVTYTPFGWDPTLQASPPELTHVRALAANGALGSDHTIDVLLQFPPDMAAADDGFFIAAMKYRWNAPPPLLLKVRPDGSEVARTTSIPNWNPNEPGVASSGTDLLVGAAGKMWRFAGDLSLTSGPTTMHLHASSEWRGSLATAAGVRLLVWDAGDLGVHASRLTTDGTILDPEPLLVLPTVRYSHGTVGTNGTDFLVGGRISGNGMSAVHVRRVTRDGALAPTPLVLGQDVTTSAPSIASDGSDYLVVWGHFRNVGQTSYGELLASRVSASGALLDAEPVRLADWLGIAVAPIFSVFDGAEYVVAFEDPSVGAIRIARVAPDLGNVELTTTPWSGQPTGFGWGAGRGMLTMFVPGLTPFSYAAVIPPRGGAFDPGGGVVLTTTPPRHASDAAGIDLIQFTAPVAWDGTSFWIAWQDVRVGTDTLGEVSALDVYARRFSPDGAALDPGGVPLAVGSERTIGPAVAFGSEPGRAVLVYPRWDPSIDARAFRLRGRVLSSAPGGDGGQGGAGGESGTTGGSGGSGGSPRGGSSGRTGGTGGSGGASSGASGSGEAGEGGNGTTGGGSGKTTGGRAGTGSAGAAGTGAPRTRRPPRDGSGGCTVAAGYADRSAVPWLLVALVVGLARGRRPRALNHIARGAARQGSRRG